MVIYIISMWMLGHLTTQSGEADAQAGLLVRGLGLGFMFVPMAVAAFAGLKGQQIAQGSALFNLMRQIGGSFGIAILNTYIVYMTHYHRADLVSAIYSGNTTYLSRVRAATAMFINHSYSAASAHSAAIAVINLSLQRQSVTMAYNDAFILLGLAFLVTMPTVLLLRKPATHAAAPAE